jgi:HlyD family secretion protein
MEKTEQKTNKEAVVSTSTEKKNFTQDSLKKKTGKGFFLLFLLIAGVIGVCVWDFYRMQEKQTPIVLYGNADIRQVNLAFRVGGRLETVLFEEGQKVKVGDKLASLEPTPFFNKLNQAKAQLAQAQAQKKNAENRLNRNIPLCQTDTVSKQKCEDIEAARDEAVANVDYATSMVQEAQTSFDDTILYAPSDGVILVRIQEAGSMLGAGTPVYTLSLNDKMWVRAYLKETELGRVKIGTPVLIETDSTQKVYKGHIGFISSQAEFTPKTIETASLRTDLVYRVRIVVDDADDFLKQGMPVTVRVLEK